MAPPVAAIVVVSIVTTTVVAFAVKEVCFNNPHSATLDRRMLRAHADV